ncbi:TPA: tail fiber protein [Escherichia coli]|uniref:phage tail protein n=1 Tax=Escherichia coli TaxID=562 RepID=UPI000F51B5F7|nr:phage tail protein [Escherichia coli]EFR5136984.1 tail fiber protein [Escherichia coli]EIF7282238.1 tail fiber protein [Escherichia coli]MBM0431745.1 tail fiber protein [Escherichia coli]MCH6732110.1 phage tail protein [Escherichia coli]MCX2368954.1 phage tail protein [Escherichia coli]
MAGTNDFKAFATDANANVTSQEEWETLTALKKGFSSGKASSAQVSKALRQPSTMAAVLGQFIANAELDALDDGDVDGLVAKLATAITTNLGLGEGSALPVGVPVPWPSATPPTGWLKCNGAAFSAEEYPELAKVYPTNKLPDLRGEFIRGWDDGRQVDDGRGLLSSQGDASRNITGTVEARTDNTIGRFFSSNPQGVFSTSGEVGGYAIATATVPTPSDRLSTLHLDISRQVPTANEFRPRNIAFNYIVRAA